jgi:SnoaL-like domain
MSHSHILSSLTPREAVTDAVHRALIGLDRNGVSIFNSAFAGEDVLFSINDGSGRIYENLTAVRTEILGLIGPMDTTHMLSNVRVDIKLGVNTASLTAYASGQHCPPGKGKESDTPKFLVGGEFFVYLVKDKSDGLWKMTKWVLDVIWTQGDASVMQRSQEA